MLRELLYGPPANFPPLLVVILGIWSLFWKSIVLWKSARNSQKFWFIALLLVNTAGILDIVYLAFFQKLKLGTKKSSKAKK